jgi:NADPH:quinone reductase-like Zn-dependent oxidoreductase
MKALGIVARDAVPAVLEVPDPSPAAGDVRVVVEAASVNGFDLAIAAGYVWDVMPHTFPVVLGRDFVGRIDAVGDAVDTWQVGDRVAGIVVAAGLGPGAFGDYAVNPASAVTKVPDGLDVTTAAAVGLAGIAAHDAVDALEIRAGETLFVSGATGGVGSVVVQLAVGLGAVVVATAKPGAEEDFVRSLGARHTVDYTGDVAALVRAVVPAGVDNALHAAGDPASVATTLRPGGRLASMLGSTAEQIGRDDVSVTAVVAKSTPEKLAGLLRQVAESRLQVRVNLTVPLARATEALEAFGRGSLGKVLVTR